MVAIISLIGAMVLGGLAARYGAEQRPGFDEHQQVR
jgi:hypothetical protein